MTKTAYDEGYDAGLEGETNDDNPWIEGTEESAQWFLGCLAAGVEILKIEATRIDDSLEVDKVDEEDDDWQNQEASWEPQYR